MIELERLYKWMSHSLAIFIEFLTRAPKTQRKPPSSRLRSDCIFKQFYKFYWQHYCFCHAWGATNQHKWLSAHHRFDKRHLITWYSYYIRCDWTKIQIQNVLKKKCGQKKLHENVYRSCGRARATAETRSVPLKHTTRCDRMKCSISFLLRRYFSKLSQPRVFFFFFFFLLLVFRIRFQ